MIKKLISSIPEGFKQRQLQMSKESSLKWFDKLPDIIDNVVAKWELSNCDLVKDESFNNIVFFADSPEYGKVIVKIGHPAYELFFCEPKALEHYNGRNACKLHDLDCDNLAMLLERLYPGKSLLEVEDRNARIKIAIDLLKKINQPVEEEMSLSKNQDMIPDYFYRAKLMIEEDEQLKKLINIAERLFSEIISEEHTEVLTHGDYHYGNILQSKDKYKVIDPKGLIGFGFMDTARLIKNELSIAKSWANIKFLDQVMNVISEYSDYKKSLLSKWLFVESVRGTAGDVLYIKSEKQKLRQKIERNKFYLKYYQQCGEKSTIW